VYDTDEFFDRMKVLKDNGKLVFVDYYKHLRDYKPENPYDQSLAEDLKAFEDFYQKMQRDTMTFVETNVKNRNDMIKEIVEEYKDDASTLSDQDYEAKYNVTSVKRMRSTAFEKTLQSYNDTEIRQIYERVKNFQSTEGKGLKVKINKSEKSKKPNDKYFIDKKKFNKNILEVKYKKNNHLLEKFKTTKISNDLKTKIGKGLVADEYDESDLDNVKLDAEEQRIYNSLMKLFGNEVDDDENDELMSKFDTLVGQIKAGNDNPLLKQQLRSMLIYAMKTNAMRRGNVLDYFLEFNL
jgi:hypothetical protein